MIGLFLTISGLIKNCKLPKLPGQNENEKKILNIVMHNYVFKLNFKIIIYYDKTFIIIPFFNISSYDSSTDDTCNKIVNNVPYIPF